MTITNWSTNPGDNDDSPPNGAPEGHNPSDTNNIIRQVMADTRAFAEDGGFLNRGDSPSYVSGNSFTVSGDLTQVYSIGRRLRAVGTGTGTIYGTVADSSFSSPNTTITVSWDSGTLQNEAITISIGGDIEASLPLAIGDVRRDGAVVNGTTDDSTAIQATIDRLTAAGGGDLIIPGNVFCGSTLTNKANVRICGLGRDVSVITAGSGLTNLVTSADGTNNIGYLGLTFDGNNNVSSILVNATGVNGYKMIGCRLTSWSTGLLCISSVSNAAKNGFIQDVILDTPATVSAGNPLRIASGIATDTVKLLPENWILDSIICEGIQGGFTPGNSSTADQIVFQGVQRGAVTNCISRFGGENGYTLGRLCSDIVIANNIAELCDSHGIQTGTSFVRITVADASSWAVNDTITDQTTGANGTAQAIDGNDVYVNAVVSGRFVVGNNASNGSVASQINSVFRSQNNIVANNVCRNNALDGNSTGSAFHGFFSAQADGTVYSANSAYDDRSPRLQNFGLALNQCDDTVLGTNDFERNLDGSVDVVGDGAFRHTEVAKLVLPNLSAAKVLSGGAFTPDTNNHRVDGEGAAADTLETINGGKDGEILFIRPVTATRPITVADLTGNIRLDEQNRQIREGTATFNPPSIAGGGVTTTTVTVTGAVFTDIPRVSFSIDLNSIMLFAYVSAADTVTVVFFNPTGGAIDLGSGTLRVRTEAGASKDFVMDNSDDTLGLKYHGNVNAWVEFTRTKIGL